MVADAAALFREAERVACERLERGYRDDTASLHRLMARPLNEARRELRERILSIGPLDPTFRRALLVQEGEQVALRCALSAFANADVRFRARSGMYATALANAYERHLEHPPKRITLPHLVLEDERSVIPRCDVSLATIDEWIDELGVHLHAALEEEAWHACRVTAERGSRSLARARIALRLEARRRRPRVR